MGLKKKKPSFISKLKIKLKQQTAKGPFTFNIGVAIILFFTWFSITIVILPTLLISIIGPIFLLLVISTLYIIIQYIKLERDRNDQRS